MPKIEKIQLVILVLLRVMGLALVATVLLAVYFYPENYSWFEEFFSNLGRIESRSGLDNTISSRIFTVGLLICAILSLLTSLLYFLFSKHQKVYYFKGVLSFFMAVGAFGTSFPAGLPKTYQIHIWGTGLFIFSFILLNLTCQIVHIAQSTPKSKPDKIYDSLSKIWVFLIVGSAIFYLIDFVLWLDEFIAIIQKIVVVEIIIALFFLERQDI